MITPPFFSQFSSQFTRLLGLSVLLITAPLPSAVFANSHVSENKKTIEPSITTSEKTHLKNIGLSKEVLEKFCTENPIWSAFAIAPETCLVAATFCARKSEFANIDPVILSEPYYQCVFKQLEIEAN